MGEVKQAIVVRKDLGMRPGKTAAQCAHASLEALEKARAKDARVEEAWEENGKEKVVLKVDSEKELLELFQSVKKEIPAALIKDAGRTQVKAGTATCIGIGPWEEAKIDKYTGRLKLL